MKSNKLIRCPAGLRFLYGALITFIEEKNILRKNIADYPERQSSKYNKVTIEKLDRVIKKTEILIKETEKDLKT